MHEIKYPFFIPYKTKTYLAQVNLKNHLVEGNSCSLAIATKQDVPDQFSFYLITNDAFKLRQNHGEWLPVLYRVANINHVFAHLTIYCCATC